MKFSSAGAAWVLGGALASWSPSFAGTPDPAPPNLVLIVLDDVGVETLGCYGPMVPTPPTPRLSALAASGVRFTRVYGNSLCSPTRATILTGRHAFRTGMSYLASWIDTMSVPHEYSLPLGEVTIPEVLSAPAPPLAPYSCGAFGKWHLAAIGDLGHPIAQGFDSFVGTATHDGTHFSWNLIRADGVSATSTHIGSAAGPFDETTYSASVIRREASAWIESAPEPFFAYVAFHPPHAPWQVPPHSLLSSPPSPSEYPAGEIESAPIPRRLAYRWMLESVDTEIGRLLDGIPAEKRARTTVLVVSDNGTPGSVIDTYNTAAIGPPPDNAQLRYETSHAKGSMYEQGVRVPMIASGYGVHPGGLACSGLVSTVDVWRTLIALAGRSAPPGVVIDGVSFAHMLADPGSASLRTTAFMQLYVPNTPYDPRDFDDHCNDFMFWMQANHRAITDGRFKYIRRYSQQPYQQAFDLSVDPLEKRNIWPWSQGACTATPTTSNQSAIWALRNALVQMSGL